MFSKTGKKKKKIAKTWDIINYLLPHCLVQFSFSSCQEQKEPDSVKVLRQGNQEYYFVSRQFTFHGTWADPLRRKMMVNHVPFMHSYLGFFSKVSIQHTISLLLTVPNTFLDSAHNAFCFFPPGPWCKYFPG